MSQLTIVRESIQNIKILIELTKEDGQKEKEDKENNKRRSHSVFAQSVSPTSPTHYEVGLLQFESLSLSFTCSLRWSIKDRKNSPILGLGKSLLNFLVMAVLP